MNTSCALALPFEGTTTTYRTTPDGKRMAVFDIIRGAMGVANPKDTWADLSNRYPEVVGFSDYFQFQGQGQRPTPVLDREGFVRLMLVLPGPRGAKFREAVAPLILRHLDGLPAEETKRPQLPGEPCPHCGALPPEPPKETRAQYFDRMIREWTADWRRRHPEQEEARRWDLEVDLTTYARAKGWQERPLPEKIPRLLKSAGWKKTSARWQGEAHRWSPP